MSKQNNKQQGWTIAKKRIPLCSMGQSPSKVVYHQLFELLGTSDSRKDAQIISLLANNWDWIDVNRRSFSKAYEGWTMLHLACYFNRPEVVKLLLSHPLIDVNAVKFGGGTPLHLAAWTSDACTRLLLADPRCFSLNWYSCHNQTPLHRAVYFGRVSVVQSILSSYREMNDIHLIPHDLSIAECYEDGKGCFDLLQQYLEADKKHLFVQGLRKKLGLPDLLPSRLLLLVLLVCGGYLRLKQPNSFFASVIRLPLEMQMILCNR